MEKYRHSLQTRQKIAEANTGKVFSEERKRNIGLSKQTKISPETIKEIKVLWNLGYVHEAIIMKRFGFGKKVYDRLKKEYCTTPQFKFLPTNMSIDEIEYIITQCTERVPYKDIADNLNRGHKQLRNVILKLAVNHDIKPHPRPKGNHTHMHRNFLSKQLITYNKQNPKLGKANGNFNKGLFGEKNGNWKGGISNLSSIIRTSSKYQAWRLSVYKRDKFKCTFCQSNKNIHADHIYPFRLLLEDGTITSIDEALKYEPLYHVDNGRTLCALCHKKTKTWAAQLQKQKKLFKYEGSSKKT